MKSFDIGSSVFVFIINREPFKTRVTRRQTDSLVYVIDPMTNHEITVPETSVFSEDFFFRSGVDGFVHHIHQNAKNKGFWETDRCFGESIALIHSELSEALEAARHGNKSSEKIPGFSHVEEELADAIIRIFDLCAYNKFNISEAILAKHEYNKNRPYLHGKKF